MSAAEKQVPGTAVATIEPPTDQEIEQIRKRGARAVAHRQEVAKIAKQIAGLEWGTGTSVVRGSEFSDVTRSVFAEFCALVRANPMYHVDMLGSRPYLNSNYWSDLINSRPDFHHYEQRDLSPSVEKALRERAARHREVAAELGNSPEAAQRRAKALDMEEEADDIALARAQWSAPPWAEVVTQTTIWKFIDAAPIEAIRAGSVTDLDRYLVTVHECNWAGNRPPKTGKRSKERGGGEYSYDPDPIGNAEPAKTARTRSLRRAAVKAFSAWMQAYERQIEKAEEALEAEYEIIREERNGARALLPAAGEAQAVRTGNGEPSAAAANGAKDLPVEDVRGEMRVTAETGVKVVEEKFTDPPAFDPEDARKAFFATLNDAGIKGDARKKWCTDNELPASTKEFTREHYDRAMSLLLAPVRNNLIGGANAIGADPEQLAQETFGRAVAQLTYREVAQLVEHINAQADGRLV